MSDTRVRNCFELNLIIWKILALWPFDKFERIFKYYSLLFFAFMVFLYNVLLTINVIYVPPKVEIIVRELIFYFTEIAVVVKVLMIIYSRKKINDVFNILQSDMLQGVDVATKKILESAHSTYRTCYIWYTILCHVTYFLLFAQPFVSYFALGTELTLPVCKYYFLSDEFREKYIVILFMYQGIGIYVHMMYNVNIDTFISGVMYMAVAQLDLLYYKMKNMKSKIKDKVTTGIVDNDANNIILKDILVHYDLLLRYCSMMQSIVSVSVFFQFGMASGVICIVSCGIILMPANINLYIFLGFYLTSMLIQIFVPCWVGTQLNYKSQQLVLAAYKSHWMEQSPKFKKSLMLFMQRAIRPIELTGYKMFPISIRTFTWIIKTAYSFFALLRNVQDRAT